jgi:hypothetical protein
MRVFVLVLLALSYACSDPDGSGQPDAGQGGTGGAGPSDAGTGGEGAESGASSDIPSVCSDNRHPIGACISPTPAFVGEAGDPVDEAVLGGLTVLGAVSPDPLGCSVSVPDPDVPPSIEALSAYELQDASGAVWTIQFAVGVLPNDLLRAGDAVDVSMMRTRRGAVSAPPAGGMAIHLVDGRPLLLINSSSPRVPVQFEAGEPECGASQCDKSCAWSQEVTLRATVGNESVLIGLGDSAELGGMMFRKAYLSRLVCPCVDLAPQVSLVGGYALR